MKNLLQDLASHGAWADAEHWRALEAHAGALEDGAIRKRLHHIHLAQRAFLALAQGDVPRLTELADYATMAALRDEARDAHVTLGAFLQEMPEDRLDTAITIPWFKDPPCRVRVGEALHQAAMHSHYHRGQNATRLRELGGHPPLTDLIVWYWKGRPSPAWP